MELPELNDDFAKKLSFESAEDLKIKTRENLEKFWIEPQLVGEEVRFEIKMKEGILYAIRVPINMAYEPTKKRM